MKKGIISLLSIIGIAGITLVTFIACSSQKEDVITLDAEGGKIEDSDASSLKLDYKKNETWSEFYIANKYIGATKDGYDFICWTLDGKTPITNDYVFTKPVTLKPLYVKNRDCITIACRYLDDNFVDFANDYSIFLTWPYSEPDVADTIVEYAINNGEFQTYTSGTNLNSKLTRVGDYFSFKTNGYIKASSSSASLPKIKIIINDKDGIKNGSRFSISGPIDALTGGKDFPTINAFSLLFESTIGICSASGLDLARKTLTERCYELMFTDCKNLIYAPALPSLTLANSCYSGLFKNCASLTIAPKLPATDITSNCYHSMFSGCTSLVTPPELPATDIEEGCYWEMFSGCTSLVTPPELPATDIAERCYYTMFSNCSSLTAMPELPATTLHNMCYSGMFGNCTSLVNVTSLPATTLVQTCYIAMFSGCRSLVTAPEMMFENESPTSCAMMFQGCTTLNFIKLHYSGSELSSICTGWLEGVASNGRLLFNGDIPSDDPTVIPETWTVYRY